MFGLMRMLHQHRNKYQSLTSTEITAKKNNPTLTPVSIIYNYLNHLDLFESLSEKTLLHKVHTSNSLPQTHLSPKKMLPYAHHQTSESLCCHPNLARCMKLSLSLPFFTD